MTQAMEMGQPVRIVGPAPPHLLGLRGHVSGAAVDILQVKLSSGEVLWLPRAAVLPVSPPLFQRLARRARDRLREALV